MGLMLLHHITRIHIFEDVYSMAPIVGIEPNLILLDKQTDSPESYTGVIMEVFGDTSLFFISYGSKPIIDYTDTFV